RSPNQWRSQRVPHHWASCRAMLASRTRPRPSPRSGCSVGSCDLLLSLGSCGQQPLSVLSTRNALSVLVPLRVSIVAGRQFAVLVDYVVTGSPASLASEGEQVAEEGFVIP